jgi:hypothetical protein
MQMGKSGWSRALSHKPQAFCGENQWLGDSGCGSLNRFAQAVQHARQFLDFRKKTGSRFDGKVVQVAAQQKKILGFGKGPLCNT